MQKFNSQFSFFSYARIIWMFLMTYSMLNLLDMTQDPTTIDFVGAVVSGAIVIAGFVFLCYGFALIKKFDGEKRRELSWCNGLK